MCTPSKMDELFTVLRQLNESLHIFNETGRMDKTPTAVSNQEFMQATLDIHFNLRFLTVILGSWMSSIVANDPDACEGQARD